MPRRGLTRRGGGVMGCPGNGSSGAHRIGGGGGEGQEHGTRQYAISVCRLPSSCATHCLWRGPPAGALLGSVQCEVQHDVCRGSGPRVPRAFIWCCPPPPPKAQGRVSGTTTCASHCRGEGGAALQGLRWGQSLLLVASLPGLPRTGGGPCHGKLVEPTHQKAPEKSLGIKEQSCPMLQLSHQAVW